MSDSSVKAGVEDVLSSIKRLVRVEGRKTLNEKQQGGPEKPARLVLTDALRVSELTETERNESLRTLARDFSVDAFWIDGVEFPRNPPANDELKPMVLKASDRVYPDSAGLSAEVQDPVAVYPESRESRSGRSPDDLAGSLSAKIEALEAAIARTEDQWEPDGDGVDDYAGTQTRRITWDYGTENAEADGADVSDTQSSDDPSEVQPEPLPQTAAFVRSGNQVGGQKKESEPATEQMATANIGEEELRDLVKEIVQQELQGALGERITRNIRKLVRREINRALAAQNLN